MRHLLRTVGVAAGVGLAAVAPTAAQASSPPADNDARITAAREGLAGWLAANKPSSPSESTDLDGCPVIDLDTFEAAMGEAGLTADLGDWGTEIEWDEYEDIDPDLMGVICGGDTDGDSHDSSFELAGGVVAVDAGTAERAIDVLAGLGFGALDVSAADVAGIPGGEVSEGCFGDAGLHACLALWNLDGLVLGVTLWSDSQELPPDSATAVLGAVLPSMLDTLAANSATDQQSTASAPPVSAGAEAPAGDGTPVGEARAKLRALLAATPDTPDAAPLDGCVLADADVVDGAFETAGVDAPLDGWGQWIGRVAPLEQFDQRGVVCEGSYVGATGDPSFPELMAALAAVDFGGAATLDAYLGDYLGIAADEGALPTPGAGGATTGRCAERDRVYDCYEVWTDGSGFAVMLHVQDRTFFDRPTASAVLDRLVPVVLTALGSGGEDESPLASLTDAEVDAAAAGLAAVVAAPAGAGTGECAVLGRAELDAALAAAGIESAVDDWIGTVTSDGSASPETSYVCRSMPPGESEGLTLFVGDFATPADAGDFIASVALTDGGTAADLDPAATTHGSCVAAGGTELCGELWQRGTFVVGVTAAGPADDVSRGDAAALLVEATPAIVQTLSAGHA